MTRFTPQWLQAGSYPASVDRRVLQALWPVAGSWGLAVTVQPGGMVMNIAPGACAVPTANQSGSVLCASDTVEQVELQPAPSLGLNRYDVITVLPRAADIGVPGVNNDFIFNIISGQVLATPVVPPVPPGQVALVQVLVRGGEVTVAAADIRDVRPGGLKVPSGLPPTPVFTGAEIASFTDETGEVWVAKAGVHGGAWRRARDVLHAWYYRAAPFPINVGLTLCSMDTMYFDDYGLYSVISGAMTCPLDGLWKIEFHLAGGDTPGPWMQCTIAHNGNIAAAYGMAHLVNAVWNMATASAILPMSVSDTAYFTSGASSAMAGTPGAPNTYANISYVGTG